MQSTEETSDENPTPIYTQEPDPLQDEYSDQEDEDEDDMVTLSINRIIPGLWIGDYVASQQYDILRQLGISHVIAAMRQKYNVPSDFTLHRVLIDDTDKTNIITHFDQCNEIIHNVLAKNQGILVHCQAGVSRSTTLCAAFLMHEFGYTTDEAIEKISSVRSQVSPTEFFLHQLEMYERMGHEVDPASSNEYRRFLMHFNHEDIMDGDGHPNQLYLAYYPTPATTPRDRSMSDPFKGLRMTPVEGSRPTSSFSARSRTGSQASIGSNSSQRSGSFRRPSRSDMLSMTSMGEGETPPVIPRGRRSRLASGLEMTPSQDASSNSSSSQLHQTQVSSRDDIRAMLKRHADEQRKPTSAREKAEQNRQAIRAEAQNLIQGKSGVLKFGQGRVQIRGRRLRCKMCRRELVAREHIVEHAPGQGQRAFAPRRRDMAQHRINQERHKAEKERETLSKGKGPEGQQEQSETAESSEEKATTSEEKVENLEGKDAEATTGSAAMNLSLSQRRHLDLHLDLKESPQPDSAIDDDDEAKVSPPLLCSTLCNSYFTEPLSWMSDQLGEGSLGGRIDCPNKKCGAKLGNFDWAGLQCSCGAWVVPAFSISASKVDEV